MLYGEPIQLRHYKSRKYLDVARNILAKNEKENMKVSLSTYGTILSHLCFTPKSKYDKEGSVVKQRDEMNLKVTLTHSLTYSLTHLLTHSLTYLLTHSLTSLLTHLLTYSLTHSLPYSLTYVLTHSLTHLLTYLLTHSLTHLLTHRMILKRTLSSWLSVVTTIQMTWMC